LNADTRLKEYDAKLASAESEVRGLLNKAATDAEKIATSIRMQAQQETEEAKERAVKDIEQARNEALREVYEQAANLATNVAEKILGRNLNAADQRDLVNASLEQLQTVAKNN
jgi:F-type H+-transporting ATPase subunit b